MKPLSELLEGRKYKVYNSPTLWDISQDTLFKALKLLRCPWCGCKLKFMKKPMAYCKSVKHRQKFLISMDKLNWINGK